MALQGVFYHVESIYGHECQTEDGETITVTLIIYWIVWHEMSPRVPGFNQWKSLYSWLTCTGIINTVTNRSATAAMLTNMKLVIDLESGTFQTM